MDRTFRKILKRIAPDGMSPEEYVIRCAVNNVKASPDDLQFVEWLLVESAYEVEGGRYDDVGDLLCDAVESGLLLDFKNLAGENDNHMADVVSGGPSCGRTRYSSARCSALSFTRRRMVPGHGRPRIG